MCGGYQISIANIAFFHLGLIFPFNYTFYFRNNTGWIANKEIDLDPNNSVINWLWCICKLVHVGLNLVKYLS